MNKKPSHIKLILAIIYLITIFIGLYFLFTTINIEDLTSYEFIKKNKNIIIKYKNESFLFISIIFFIFTIIWVLFLGFVTPLALFAGFVFGKWRGSLILITSISMGATMLYLLAGFFLQNVIKNKLAPKFSKFKEFFNKNDTLYFMTL